SSGIPAHVSSGNLTAASTSTHVLVNGLSVPNSDSPSPEYDKAAHAQFKKVDTEHGVPVYLEDEDGKVFSPMLYHELREHIKRILRTLSDHGLAPPTWGQRNIHASRFAQQEIYKAYPVLAKCQGHMRINNLITRMYPDFARYALRAVKNEDSKEPISSTVPLRGHEKRAALQNHVPARATKRAKSGGAETILLSMHHDTLSS
ncbi:hypothetical protein BD414DRAFT_414229, partial [Trametes punicea]